MARIVVWIEVDDAGTTLVKFPGKRSDTSYTIPDSVKYIGYNAFSGCDGLGEIIIEGEPDICSNSFSGCSGDPVQRKK